MAGGLMGPSGGGGSRFNRTRYRPMSDINVTPFVDVMLVLLIVFMVTAPLLTVGVPVDLPETRAASLNDAEEPLVLTVDREGVVYIQETAIEEANLIARLRAVTGNNPDVRIFVRGDSQIRYGRVMEVMGQLSAAGFSKVALLARLPGQEEGVSGQ
ncbi:MAG: protein TolR [Marivibrio sp.]|uniref:protein TolR n=1 Tax=Marivibrio sp. TaxID=2039719 RepID=UPI0032ED7274